MHLNDLPDDSDYCWQCGTLLPFDCFYGIRKFCCRKCRRDYHNSFVQQERHRMRKGRTCAHCGGPIPETRINAAYTCGDACTRARQIAQMGERDRKRRRQEKGRRICEQCGAPISPEKRRDARFCTRSCKGKAGRSTT